MPTRFEVPGDDAAVPAPRSIGTSAIRAKSPQNNSAQADIARDNTAHADTAHADTAHADTAHADTAQENPDRAGVGPMPSVAAGEPADDAGAFPRSVPDATVARLATYLRVVSAFAERRVETVSSEELAVAAGVNSAKLRKDLSHLGSYGVRGVGYSVTVLAAQLARTLGLSEHHRVVVIGVGNLGQALSGYDGFATRGFEIAALLDSSSERVGMTVRGLIVRHIDELLEVVRSEGISIGIIATPAAAAQEVCDALAAAGVTAILNFAPTVLSVPESVDVRKVDLAAELQILSFHEQRKARGLSPLPVSSEQARAARS